MKTLLLLSIFLSGYLLAADSDLDGVDDTLDQCSNTSFTDLVDASGCTIRSLQSHDNYDIIVGAGYSQTKHTAQTKSSTTVQTLQADYYHKNIWVQIAGSYFQSSTTDLNTTSGSGDTLLAVYYKIPFENGLTIQTGIGALLPTYKSGYNNESTDYQGSLSFQYAPNDTLNIFGGYNYTIVTDKNVSNSPQYQNTQSFYAGLGYALGDKATISSSYAQSQSMYVGAEPIETVSANLYYQLSSHWFTMLDYRYGLSDSASDHEAGLRLGYYF